MPLLGVLMNIERRQILSAVVIEMVKACDKDVTDDEVYELMDAYHEKDPKMTDLSKVVMEELLAALGNTPAEIKLTLKTATLERQRAQRNADAAIKKRLAELEGADPPDGPGEKLKSSALEPSD